MCIILYENHTNKDQSLCSIQLLDARHDTVFWLGDLNYRLKLSPLPKSILLGDRKGDKESDYSTYNTGQGGGQQLQLDIGDLPLELMEENVSTDASTFRLTPHDVLFHVDRGDFGLLSDRDELKFEIAQAQRSEGEYIYMLC